MDKLVSIILPVYNGEKYLRQSIDSVLMQTYQNWELIIVDDCSTDSTEQIIMEYVQQDKRVKYYKNEVNLKLPRNLNRGFSLAKGEYLTWHSDDNMYHPDAINRMVAALQQCPAAQFVFASCQYIDENDENLEVFIACERGKRSMVGINGVRACFLYTRKVYETIGDYDPTCVLVEDYDYWQRIFAKFETVAIKDVLYTYRLHSSSLTGTMRKSYFYEQLEKILLKNRPLFGRLTIEQRYYYYAGLYDCRASRKAKQNPYKLRYWLYRSIRTTYLTLLRIVGKGK